jgi:hypothetical protein
MLLHINGKYTIGKLKLPIFMPSATSVGMCARLFMQSATSVLLWLFIQSSISVVMFAGLLYLASPGVL